jgi:hypothetical protein
LASGLNFTAGRVVANNVIAAIGNEGAVCVYANVPTDVIVDIAGWFSDAAQAILGRAHDVVFSHNEWR